MNKVINFHKIRDSAWFEKVITLLKSRFNMVGIEELEDSLKNGKLLNNICHITIDDGDRTFYDVIYPVLKKHHVPATIFISPDVCMNGKNFWFQEIEEYNYADLKRVISDLYRIDFKIFNPVPIFWILKNFRIDEIWEIIRTYQQQYNIKESEPQNINVEQLLEIDKFGLVQIGAHTLNHPVLANEDDDICNKEIIDSFTGLREILGHEIRYFAYPNGLPGLDFGEREINILKYAECRIAFTTEPADLALDEYTLTLPRYCFDQRNIMHFRVKLYMGQFWDRSRNLLIKGERKARLELKRKIKVSK